MPHREWYKDWFDSPYYHELYFNRDDSEARQFIDKLLDVLKPSKGARMLDVACGRGRHSRILADKGFDVTGIDLSFQSILFAKQFENDHLQFYQHDMRLPAWINYFDIAFNFFTSFGYFKTEREHNDAASTISRSLRLGGKAVFDYLNVHFAEEHLVHNEEKRIGDTHYDIHRWMDNSHFYKQINVDNDDKNDHLSFTEKVAKLTLGDFTDMLAYQGLQIQEVYGDYGLGRYHIRQSPRMILIAEKIH